MSQEFSEWLERLKNITETTHCSYFEIMRSIKKPDIKKTITILDDFIKYTRNYEYIQDRYKSQGLFSNEVNLSSKLSLKIVNEIERFTKELEKTKRIIINYKGTKEDDTNRRKPMSLKKRNFNITLNILVFLIWLEEKNEQTEEIELLRNELKELTSDYKNWFVNTKFIKRFDYAGLLEKECDRLKNGEKVIDRFEFSVAADIKDYFQFVCGYKVGSNFSDYTFNESVGADLRRMLVDLGEDKLTQALRHNLPRIVITVLRSAGSFDPIFNDADIFKQFTSLSGSFINQGGIIP